MREEFTQRQGKRLRLGVALLPSVFLPSLSHALVAATVTYRHFLSSVRSLFRLYILRGYCFARSLLRGTQTLGGLPAEPVSPGTPFPSSLSTSGVQWRALLCTHHGVAPPGSPPNPPPLGPGGPVARPHPPGVWLGASAQSACPLYYERPSFLLPFRPPFAFSRRREKRFFSGGRPTALFPGGVLRSRSYAASVGSCFFGALSPHSKANDWCEIGMFHFRCASMNVSTMPCVGACSGFCNI